MTWPPDVPFWARLATLLVLMIMGAAIDVAVRGREATRPREYAFLLAAGAIGALFALCTDQVTSRLSPEYFVIGKGLDEGPTFARAVVELGLQAGLVAGLVLGGVLLLANQAKPDRPALPLARVLLRAGWPLGGALLVAPIGALTGVALFPGGMRGELARLLDAEPLERFMRVWGVHLGLYVGAVAGVIVAVVDVRRRRRAMSVVVLAACLSGCATPGEEMEERVARLHARADRGDASAMLALAEAELGEPSLLRAVVRLLQDRRDEALADLERSGAHLWLAGLGADPRRHWNEVCRKLADRPIADGDALAARLHLGRTSPDELRSWADDLPASDDRPRHRFAAYLHLGLHADRRGDRAAARVAYSECVHQSTWGGTLLDSPELVWVEARLRAID